MYVIDVLYVALVELTAPLVGALAPPQVTGALQSVPVHPVVHVQVNPVAPIGAHVPPFWHGFGVQPVMLSEHVGAVPDQVMSAWQVRVDEPEMT